MELSVPIKAEDFAKLDDRKKEKIRAAYRLVISYLMVVDSKINLASLFIISPEAEFENFVSGYGEYSSSNEKKIISCTNLYFNVALKYKEALDYFKVKDIFAMTNRQVKKAEKDIWDSLDHDDSKRKQEDDSLPLSVIHDDMERLERLNNELAARMRDMELEVRLEVVQREANSISDYITNARQTTMTCTAVLVKMKKFLSEFYEYYKSNDLVEINGRFVTLPASKMPWFNYDSKYGELVSSVSLLTTTQANLANMMSENKVLSVASVVEALRSINDYYKILKSEAQVIERFLVESSTKMGENPEMEAIHLPWRILEDSGILATDESSSSRSTGSHAKKAKKMSNKYC